MGIKISIFVIICLVGNCFEVGAILLSNKEDLELEKQLRLINKPSLATITTFYGDVYDCIDFYKQPAFDHILLKNHTFYPQMDYKYVNKNNSNNSSSINARPFKIFKEGGCPVGSVPIRRTTKADLIREKKYLSKFESLERANPDVAIVQTSKGYGPFNGAGMIAGVYKPKASGLQYSGVRLRLQNNEDLIQIGWRDQATGNWWVEVGNNIRLGFWPAGLFSDLRKLATYVDWGGEVFNTNDKKEIDMGLGAIPYLKEIDRTAYCRVLQVSTPDGKTTDAARTQSYTNEQYHYNILNIDHADDYYRHLILYGGPYRNF
ncbi:uncharacterized protein LOC124928180 [Impatiens glandulifera]|uniref:uncharacterized protein LOC124928180 n=1 Tax=Impatiens glandulifera TaxID=253017 RepID=UPI001FB11118|nr:uncharacterized protein LOC124928180 [Impatiens glandulifera]